MCVTLSRGECRKEKKTHEIKKEGGAGWTNEIKLYAGCVGEGEHAQVKPVANSFQHPTADAAEETGLLLHHGWIRHDRRESLPCTARTHHRGGARMRSVRSREVKRCPFKHFIHRYGYHTLASCGLNAVRLDENEIEIEIDRPVGHVSFGLPEQPANQNAECRLQGSLRELKKKNLVRHVRHQHGGQHASFCTGSLFVVYSSNSYQVDSHHFVQSSSCCTRALEEKSDYLSGTKSETGVPSVTKYSTSTECPVSSPPRRAAPLSFFFFFSRLLLFF